MSASVTGGPEDKASPRAPAGPAAVSGLPERYAIAGALGSRTWSAVDRETGEAVVIKTDDDLGAIRREAMAIASVSHPGVVRLRAFGQYRHGGYLVVDQAEGETLAAMVARAGGRLRPSRTVSLLARLAEALTAVHAAGWLHRDLKPANVVVHGGEAPVIVDFSAARRISPRPSGERFTELTEGFAAPEQYAPAGREGPWTDVYGLSALAYCVLAGMPPPSAPARLAGTPLPPLPGGAENARLHNLVLHGLALDPAARPESAAAFRMMLDTVDGDPDPFPPTVRIERADLKPQAPGTAKAAGRRDGDGGGPAAPRWRRRWPAALLAAVVVVGAGWLAWRQVVTARGAWLVDAAGGGDVRTVGEAIERARDDAVVLIRPGTYAESLTLAKRLHLKAADGAAPPAIAPAAGPCLRVTAAGATVSGLDFRGASGIDGDPPPGCIIVFGGDVVLADNRVAGGPGPAIVIGEGAAPRVRGNRIDQTKDVGILVTGSAVGHIEGNTIAGGDRAGIIVRGGARPTIVDNRVEGTGGVLFAEESAGRFERNHISGSRGSAVQITGAAAPAIVGNTIASPGEAGIFVYDGGAGVIDGNTVTAAALSGLVLAQAGAVAVTGNTVAKSGEYGILVLGADGARIDRNTVRDSRRNGIVLAEGAKVELGKNILDGNEAPQLLDARPR